ncbi:PIG-L family deacetylase [Rudaeicoccus suwonensis]|uniref:N-acetyl-1-D-myo-inositol-2-amino-2-deoxy-alpha-D-glucopyranoside deacetylase n=1 Tax=Rudaeicoccus suwonensis TaxID=657409 RepID=A0A561E122_9MICO|nr:PIG-L family deacetylase [Rudaeicoccus suwonensis]TWE09335.1 N-acetyl-1-D-myo-inositol-2-amino-2-deoxy-alpha-D-glucopyranoside deacetylase [Rudaeicoccus suwonensis]
MTRLLFVHAHPDDESLWTGLAIAHHVTLGDEVHVLTATLGEEGEVIPPELRHLELPAGQPRRVDTPDPLADVRADELRCATTQLGVTSAVVLERGGSSYRDSGMAGTPSSAHPRALTGADVDEVAAAIAVHIAAVRAEVVVTYDRTGGYGHPDHIRVHEATLRAVATTMPEPELYAVVTPRSWAEEDRAWLQAHVSRAGIIVPTAQDPHLPSVIDDAVVTHTVIDDDAIGIQAAALRCHRTQVTVYDGYFALSNDVAVRLAPREAFVRLDPRTGDIFTGAGGATGLRHTGLAS